MLAADPVLAYTVFMPLYRLHNPLHQERLLPQGEFANMENLTWLSLREATELRNNARKRLEKFHIPFEWDRWETVTLYPYLHGGKIAWLGVSGSTVEVEGQAYINDVIAGDDLSLSIDESPFFCLHRNTFYTNDEALYRRVLAECGPQAGPELPGGFASREDWLLTAALYVLRRSGGGELTLEANREYGQRLLADGNGSYRYEYWNVGAPEPDTVTPLATRQDAAEFLVRQGFVRIREGEVEGVKRLFLDGMLVEKIEAWLEREKLPVTLADLHRLRAGLRQWAGLEG